MLQGMMKPLLLFKPLVVMDAGIATGREMPTASIDFARTDRDWTNRSYGIYTA
jgi:hypothetical protein